MSLNILVAEDNAFTASQYTKILEKNGHKVQVAKDGVECIETYEKALSEFDSLDKNPFDVVLLDNNMPKKSGVEVAKEILDKNPEQKIIFVTSYQKWAVEDETDDLFDKIVLLEKPFTLNQLSRKIESLV